MILKLIFSYLYQLLISINFSYLAEVCADSAIFCYLVEICADALLIWVILKFLHGKGKVKDAALDP
jgi:hypothetical protein